MTTADADEWEHVTPERAAGSERRYRLEVSPEYAVELTVTKTSRSSSCPYELVLSTIVERRGRHVSDHPVAGYADRAAARDALHALKDVVSGVVTERDDLPDADHRLAHDVIPRFIDEHVEAEAGVCERLYDQSLHD